MKHLCVRVKGSILVETSGHVFLHEVACGSADENYELHQYKTPGRFDEDCIIIDGDLVLDEKTTVVPYASYVADKCILEKWHLRPSINVNSWRERNLEIINKLRVDIPKDCKAFFYNGLFISLCSSFELAVMDFLLNLITSSEIIYQRAVLCWSERSNREKCKDDLDKYFIDVLKYYINNIVYHRFDDLNSIYSKVIGINLPNYDSLAKLFRKRNNIVHRYSLSNLDRTTITNATQEDIENLANEIEIFMSDLERKVQDRC